MSSRNAKPSGDRPVKRRLFSFDSLRREKSGSDSETTSIVSANYRRRPSNDSSTLLTLAEMHNDENDPFSDTGPWTEKGVVGSPEEQSEQHFAAVDTEVNVQLHAPKAVPTLDLSDVKTVLGASENEVLVPPPSPSRRRWNTLRSHVLPSLTESETPSLPPEPTEIQRPGTPTSRPQTPRMYRFGQKKSMRHVVDQAREVAVDETRRLTDNIRRACWAVRYGEVSVRQKAEREGTLGTVGSTLHLPFMTSTPSLAAAYGASTVQRPPSMQSLAFSPVAVPSVTHIARALTSSSSINRPRVLPLETQVLSALLVPFLGPYTNEHAEVEQQTAVETFEYAVRTWKAPSSEEELERCLWCCKAASVPSRSRIRILGALSALLFSREKTFRTDTPIILQTLLQAMFSLLSSLASSNASSEAESLKAYIFAIKDGQCGTPTPPALEKEYGVRFSGADRNEKVRDIITTESVIGCLEVGSEACRRWSLRHLLEEYWTLPEPAMKQTPLLSCMNWRKLKTFISSAIALLSSSLADAQTLIMDCDAIVGVLRSRVLPEVEAMQNDDFAAEIQNRVVRLTLELLCIRGSSEREYVMRQFCRWFRDDMRWKLSIEKTIQAFIAEIEWPVIFRLLPTVVEELPEEIRMLMVSSILPQLNDRLMADPPEYPCTPLSVFLETVSRMCPKAFFKPIFTCAVSSKDLTIANQLCVFHIIAKYMPDFWTFDAEMMSVALMSETSNTKSRGKGAAPTWGKVRLGQLVLLHELIEHLRTVRDSKDLSALSAAAKFFTALEARLGLMLETKEQSTLIPVSQRFLFCSLFREIRLLTRSLKPASWLPSVVSWALYDPTQDADQAFNIDDDDDDEETMATFDKLQALYAQAQAGASGSGKRRTTVILPSNPDIQATKKAQNDDATPDVLADRLEKLKSLHHALRSTILELLVTISGLLTPEDYLRLTSTLWHRHLDDTSTNVVAPTCFLVMQCAEKNADDFVRIIEDDLSSTDSGVRCEAIQKVSTILSWRFQILSQEVILDRTYRRPFKLSRPPILFVPTDIGTNLFILEEDPDDFKDSNGLALPLELRRRLSEIGWTEERGEIDPRTEKIKTPMTLLPTQQLDAFSIGADTPPPQDESRSASPSPEPSPTKSSAGDMSVIRRDSSSTGRSPGARRRPVFVSTLVALFPRLASMMNDDDFLVSSIAKNLVVDLMRDDPALLSRTVFHQLSGDPSSVLSAISTLRTFLHVQHTLPPGMAHHVLNHLAGFLKSSVRHTELTHPLQSYAYCVPVIAKLVVQVGKLSIREIRRAKVDMFLIPSGSLWFPPSAPTGPMFPRALGTDNNPFEPLPSTLVWITLIRTSQNMLFLSMLKRNPQDIKAIRKHMTRLVLPSRGDNSDQSPIPLVTFAPRKRHEGALSNDLDIMALSLTLARSYLLLLNQAFRSMSRHLNDRNELAIHLDGLNRILLAHGDDIGIVAQTMLALLVASTRFRRLFTSGGGYTLFMPAVIKTYCEAESHPGIRAAIEFAINRFYALHQESFVFQTFDIMSHIITLPDVDSGWIAKNVYTLFATLKNSSPANDYDAAGICNLTKAEEHEALMVRIAEEVPQAFFASIRLGGQGQNQVTMEVPEQHEGKHLGLDDLVRLFLTVIAHNPGIQRAQHFLRFLLLLAPYLYHASGPARSVLRDGVDALGVILVNRGAGKAKVPESAQIRPLEDYSYLPDASSQGNSSQVYSSSSSSSTSDLLAMRLDYLSLVLAFTRAGGRLGGNGSSRVLELVKLILKDSRMSISQVSSFLADYTRTVLLRPTLPELKEVVTLLTDIAPIISAYCTSVDFSGVFDIVSALASNSVFANQPTFARVVVSQYCNIGLEACDLAASENLLFSLSLRGSFIVLLDRSVSLVGADVIAELEKRSPSYDFLVGVILPLVLTMKTSMEIARDSQWAEKWRRDVHSKAWVRLLVYILCIIEKADVSGDSSKSSSHGLERRKSQDNRSSATSAKPAIAFAVALQILKVIVTRAEEDLSAMYPGVWSRVGSVLRAALSDGDAAFALRHREYSEPPSPVHSPRASAFALNGQSDDPFLSPAAFRTQKRPRMIDYLTWSFVQWLCLRRSPLAIQMRAFVQEKVASLDQELSLQGTSVSFSTPRPRSRPISTIFSKPRRSMIGDATSSAASTPRSSTLLNSSISLPVFDDFGVRSSTPRKADDGGRQAGYALMPSPLTPSRRAARESGPKIVHLGPVSPSALGEASGRRSISPSGRGRSVLSALAVAAEMTVTSPILVRMTYRRIRIAQAVLGYAALLPFWEGSGNSEDEEMADGAVRAWTKADAVEAIVQETKDLMEEWREDYADVGDESAVLVDVEDSSDGTP